MPRHGLPAGVATTRARTRTLVRLLALACLLSALVCAPAFGRAKAKQLPLAADFYGVNAGGVFNLPQEQWDAQLSGMQGAGISIVRNDAAWDNVEPQAPD